MTSNESKQIMHHSLTIGNVSIRQDEKGHFCLNDLHRAAGSEAKHQPSNFMRMDGTKALIAEINQSSDVMSAYINVGGVNPGTFVSKELVYAYAMWISAAFHLKVIRAYDATVTPAIPQSLSAALRLAADQADKIEAQQAQLAIATPKAEALDLIANADGMLNLQAAGKTLQQQPNKFIAWLRENGWIYKRPGSVSNSARAEKFNAGYLATKSHVVILSDGSERVRDQVMVTPKGLAKLAGIFTQ